MTYFGEQRCPILIFTLILAASQSGCTPQAFIDSVDSNSIIVAIGDSLTCGYGVNPEYSYPSVLAKLLSVSVQNFGLNGENTSEGLRRLPSILEQTRPDLILLCYGGNDRLQKQPLENTQKNIESMIRLIQAQNCDIILIAVPQPDLSLSVPDLYETLAHKYSLSLENNVMRDVLRKASLKSDTIHPNAAGYEMIAQRIHDLILKSSS